MTSSNGTPRRPRGTGSLWVYKDKAGREAWYCRFWFHGKLVKRKVGPKRVRGTSAGLTRAQAEAALRRLMHDARSTQAINERLTLGEAARRYIDHLEALGRKRSTIEDYRSAARVHLTQFFGDRRLDGISDRDIEAFIAAKASEGKSAKSVRNWLSLMHSIFVHGEKRRWCNSNPVRLVDKPTVRDQVEIRYLDQTEVEALLLATPDDPVGLTDHALYATAVMTGLRQGELLALRWRDVDWLSRRIRVRGSYVRGESSSPKTKRGFRSVPLADRLAGELNKHHQRTRFLGDDDLVFPHPLLGNYLDRSKLVKRFKANLRRAGVREVRFHDLRHTFGTRTAAAGVPIRTLQEWMGHRDFKTTLIYADYQPSEREADLLESAFGNTLFSGQPNLIAL